MIDCAPYQNYCEHKDYVTSMKYYCKATCGFCQGKKLLLGLVFFLVCRVLRLSLQGCESLYTIGVLIILHFYRKSFNSFLCSFSFSSFFYISPSFSPSFVSSSFLHSFSLLAYLSTFCLGSLVASFLRIL